MFGSLNLKYSYDADSGAFICLSFSVIAGSNSPIVMFQIGQGRTPIVSFLRSILHGVHFGGHLELGATITTCTLPYARQESLVTVTQIMEPPAFSITSLSVKSSIVVAKTRHPSPLVLSSMPTFSILSGKCRSLQTVRYKSRSLYHRQR